MNKAFLSELGGRWSVVVQGEGRPQEYVCVSREQAERWLALMTGPLRELRASPSSPVRVRSAG